MPQTVVKTYNSKEELENARAVQASLTTYTERFYMLMKLIKVSTMIKKATIISNPTINPLVK
jgi:hypothetical protein